MMQLYRSVFICILASIRYTFLKTSTVTATPVEQISKPRVEMKQYHGHLRTLQKEVNINTIPSTTESHEEKRTQEHMPSRRIQDGYEVDSETGSLYIDGEKVDYDGTDHSVNSVYVDGDNFYVEACDGFKFELDENGFCKVSTGFIVLMLFINIAIIVGIVIASCACCKCCVWYPYLCCASDTERPPLNQQGSSTAVREPAYQPSKVVKMEEKRVTKALKSETLPGSSNTASTISNHKPKLEC